MCHVHQICSQLFYLLIPLPRSDLLAELNIYIYIYIYIYILLCLQLSKIADFIPRKFRELCLAYVEACHPYHIGEIELEQISSMALRVSPIHYLPWRKPKLLICHQLNF
jgi:hypothetical protein